ncbi:ATPase [Maridesulfovibrio sp.]|uniref:F0F1 ATP synthase subunit B family protein n=1 Tax=Maridesulfovibrio sp. TaxID=2795000 RepID=UPI002A18C48D|nr:ATPase [Maridesulfovibrio sp.]
MLLDWFTVLAQVLNFFVLLVLLRVFLYGPVVRAMEERRQRVAEEMDQARKARAEAEKAATDLAARREELDRETAEAMAQVHAEAENWRRQIMESASEEVETLRGEWLAALDREKEAVSLEFRKRLTHELAESAARMVRDLADSDIEDMALSGFLNRIADEAGDVDCGNSDIVVRTGFGQSAAQQEKLDRVLKGLFPGAGNLVYMQVPELGLGIELVAGDRKWEWNLSSYVNELEQKIWAGLGE